MGESKEKNLSNTNVYIKSEIDSKPKFTIEEVSTKAITPITQSFREKLKMKGSGLKVSLNQAAQVSNPFNQDMRNTPLSIFSVIL